MNSLAIVTLIIVEGMEIVLVELAILMAVPLVECVTLAASLHINVE